MTDLTDFKRLVHEPQIRALRDKNQELRISLKATEDKLDPLIQAIQWITNNYPKVIREMPSELFHALRDIK